MAERLTGWENGWNAKQEPQVKSYDPSWRDRVARTLIDWGAPEHAIEGLMGSRGLGITQKNMGTGLVDLTPAGAPFWLNEAERARQSGDMGGQMLNTIAAVPIPGAKLAAKAVGEGADAIQQGIRAGAVRPASISYKPAVNIDGKIFRGGSHSDALDRAAKELGMSHDELIARAGGSEGVFDNLDGFVDSNGKFVSRADAYAAVEAQSARGATAAPPPEGIRAYHGSPHDFDKFDMSKIGTGEGAQAYGHGLYLAENEATAKVYRDNLAGYKFVQDALASGRGTAAKRPAQVAEWLYADPHMSDEHITQALSVLDKTADEKQLMAWAAEGRKMLAESKDAGRMYETRINASPDEFLDWDKPLSEQPGVTKVIDDLWGDPEIVLQQMGLDPKTATGGQFQQALEGLGQHNSAAASEKLRAAGIKGIRYKDQGSRTIDPPTEMMSRAQDLAAESTRLRSAFEKSPTKEIAERFDAVTAEQKVLADKIAAYRGANETRNYVVFDDSIIEILRKYGIAGLIGGAAGAGAMGGEAKASPNAGQRQDRRKQALLNAIGK